ncbi:hypothetical protein DPMN_125433 [Dreissena polymorpha]|uniref:Uncharacterized protein n=1 Tax=Dreissena polymorpha TaxID=45954 RepID=A0A9D4JX65_DREPO|nr:hypothetical protein DPMN_125433 [Dreissena polymorpha]
MTSSRGSVSTNVMAASKRPCQYQYNTIDNKWRVRCNEMKFSKDNDSTNAITSAREV